MSVDALRFSGSFALDGRAARIVPPAPTVARALPIFDGVSGTALLVVPAVRRDAMVLRADDGVETFDRIDACDDGLFIFAWSVVVAPGGFFVLRIDDATDVVDAADDRRTLIFGALSPGERTLAALDAVDAADILRARAAGVTGDLVPPTDDPTSDFAVLNSVEPSLAIDISDCGRVGTFNDGDDGPAAGAREVRMVDACDRTEVYDAELDRTALDVGTPPLLPTVLRAVVLATDAVDAPGVSLESGLGPGGGILLFSAALRDTTGEVDTRDRDVAADAVLRATDRIEAVPTPPEGLSAPVPRGYGLVTLREATLRGMERIDSPSDGRVPPRVGEVIVLVVPLL